MKIKTITNEPNYPDDWFFNFDNEGTVDLVAPIDSEGYSFRVAIVTYEQDPTYTPQRMQKDINDLQAFQYIWSLCPNADIEIIDDDMLEYILWPNQHELANIFNNLNLRMSMYLKT